MRWMWVRCTFVVLLVMPALSLAPTPPERVGFGCSLSLDRMLPEITLCDCGFADVLGFFADISGSTIEVDWRALALVGVTQETFVNARIRNKRFDRAMTEVLDSAAGRPGVLEFEKGPGVIRIGRTRQDAGLALKWALGTAMAAAFAYSLCSHPRGSSGWRPPSV